MSTNASLLEELHVISGLAPVADAGNGTVYTDVVNMENAARALFTMHKGVGATGTSTITIEACDDVTPSTTSAIPFRYAQVTTGDTAGTVTAATSAGFTTTAGNATIVQVEVDAGELAASGYGYCRMKMVEVVDSPVLFGVTIQLGGLRTSNDAGDTYIA